MKKAILTALEDRYKAQISEADAILKIYLEKSVGIGEHPQHIDEADKLIQKIANAEEKIKYYREVAENFKENTTDSVWSQGVAVVNLVHLPM